MTHIGANLSMLAFVAVLMFLPVGLTGVVVLSFLQEMNVVLASVMLSPIIAIFFILECFFMPTLKSGFRLTPLFKVYNSSSCLFILQKY